MYVIINVIRASIPTCHQSPTNVPVCFAVTGCAACGLCPAVRSRGTVHHEPGHAGDDRDAWAL